MSRTRRALMWALALLMVAGGVNHFVRPEFYVAIMPPWLPWHLELVWLSGLFEIALGAALPVPRTRRLAAWGLIALFVAIFPANLHMALNDVPVDGRVLPPALVWGRLPLQGVLIAWAWWFTREPASARGRGAGPAVSP